MSAPPPLGLYVHVPFCQRRCSYCDFYTLARPPAPGYVDALLAELRARQHEIDPPRRAISLYLGGGTPGLLPAEALQQLIDGCRAGPGLADDAEITLEANPASAPAEQPARWRQAGANRLSLGVQSLDDRWLRLLGRLHDAAGARRAVRAAREAGFSSLSVDLILALPGQTLADSRADVEAIAALGAEHVSAYLLSVEPGTPLAAAVASGQLQPVDDDLAADMLGQAVACLAAAGYQRYEIANFARPGHAARHNRLYWSGGEYLGLGPGAHSHRRERGGGRRVSNPADLDAYLRRYRDGQRDALAALECVDEWLPPARFALEQLYLGLRDLQRGVDVAAVLHDAALPDWPALHAEIARLQQDGLVDWLGPRLRLSPAGADLADAVARDLLAVEAPGAPPEA